MKFREVLIAALIISLSHDPVLSVWKFKSTSHIEDRTNLLNGNIESSHNWLDGSESVTSLDRAEMQSHADALNDMKEAWEENKLMEAAKQADLRWREPYEWDTTDHVKMKTEPWLDALLYNPQGDVQGIWLIGDSKPRQFSHDVNDIPLIKLLIQLHKDRSEKLLEYQLFWFFNRIKKLNFEKRDTLQDTSIVDFIGVLATITNVAQRAERKLDPFSVRIQQYVMHQLPEFEDNLIRAGRRDIYTIIHRLKELWVRR